jgi:hypothetical protein
MNLGIQARIVEELMRYDWELAPDVAHVVLVRRQVHTFRGEQFAVIRPLRWFEEGDCWLRANFESRGENALALCHAYIADASEVTEKVAEFHAEVMKGLSEAFSVRMAA